MARKKHKRRTPSHASLLQSVLDRIYLLKHNIHPKRHPLYSRGQSTQSQAQAMAAHGIRRHFIKKLFPGLGMASKSKHLHKNIYRNPHLSIFEEVK